MATIHAYLPCSLQIGCRRLIWFEPVWVLGAWSFLCIPPHIIGPTSLAILVLLAFLLPWPLRWIAYGSFGRRTPIDVPVVLLCLWLPVAYWASVDKSLSWRAISLFAAGPAVAYAFVNWPPIQGRPAWLAGVVLAAGMGLAALGVLVNPPANLRARLPNHWSTAVVEFLGTPVNPNNLAGALALTVPIGLSLFLQSGTVGSRWRLAGLVAVASVLPVLVYTNSLGAVMALAMATGILLLLRWPRLAFALPILSVAAIVGVLYVGPNWVKNWIYYYGNAGGRLAIWQRAGYAFHDFSITGLGIGTFSQIVPTFYPYPTPSLEAMPHAHNLFLQVGLDLGLPGLSAYLALHLIVFFGLVMVLRRPHCAQDGALAAGTACALLVLFIHGLVDVAVWGTRAPPLPWLLIALALLLERRPTSIEQATTMSNEVR